MHIYRVKLKFQLKFLVFTTIIREYLNIQYIFVYIKKLTRKVLLQIITSSKFIKFIITFLDVIEVNDLYRIWQNSKKLLFSILNARNF